MNTPTHCCFCHAAPNTVCADDCYTWSESDIAYAERMEREEAEHRAAVAQAAQIDGAE